MVIRAFTAVPLHLVVRLSVSYPDPLPILPRPTLQHRSFEGSVSSSEPHRVWFVVQKGRLDVIEALSHRGTHLFIVLWIPCHQPEKGLEVADSESQFPY